MLLGEGTLFQQEGQNAEAKEKSLLKISFISHKTGLVSENVGF